ncbi:beta-hexosaminidase 2 [Ricinus communis]|uniref:Beta-hexosaminidase n=1 Tax=Ricinus communis TaxID=3988 RepID=B9T0D8_RICCO|nr:beta-hexosaminidase 2 [Ricinus communis]XP_015582427.1 beta-hexosaminidase 2 [Ricinus communis]EEF30666.1 beta-hexosaminidase, putative [Ricinus communis]|eukprot:XP_002531707.1 beta-hexosaminidase 2 [Ricinus communis]
MRITTFIITCCTLLTATATGITVWPKPRVFTWQHPQFATLVSPAFAITAPNHPHLSPAINRYLHQILTERYPPLINPSINISNASPPLQILSITVSNLATPLHHGVNESYSLIIPAKDSTATIIADTVWGAMRGLETFSQLVWGNPSRVPVGVYVWDAPLFGHRGLMLDTSRNYYPVSDIMRTISAMSANKLNIFHWHITDSHSFPMVFPSEPGLAEKGSYGNNMRYTPEDVADVVKFGLEHGVRVLAEIDSPAHTGSWAGAYPDLVTCANMFWWPAGSEWPDRLASEPGTGQLNPLNPKTYEVLKNIIADAVTMFPEPFYHAGGDEIIPGCWKADPAIQSFLSDNGTLSQLLETFVRSTFPYIVSLNRTVVYWEDILLDDNVKVDAAILPPEHTILQTWNNGPNNTKLIVDAGYRAIVSSSEFYYLDCGHGDFLGNDSQYDQPPTANDTGNGGSWCGSFKTWQTIYNYDITYGLSEKEAELVLGGEVALWSEQADPAVLDVRLWPRTSAMAETLWSGNRDETGMKRYAEAMDRLNEWRYRMVSRGIRAEPLQPLWCIRNPGMCNTVHPLV